MSGLMCRRRGGRGGACPPARGGASPWSRRRSTVWCEELVALAPTVIVVEASGGYESAPGECARRRGLADGRRQSAAGAGFCEGDRPPGEDRRPRCRGAWRCLESGSGRRCARCPTAETQALSALPARRRQLSDMLIAERQRRAQARDRGSLQSLDDLSAARSADQRASTRTHRRRCRPARLAGKRALLRSVPGIAPTTAPTLPSESPRARAVVPPANRRAGGRGALNRIVAPSGAADHLGRAGDGATALYMATITAVRCNPVLRTFYQRPARRENGLGRAHRHRAHS